MPRIAMAGTHSFVCTHTRGHCHRCRGWLPLAKMNYFDPLLGTRVESSS
jgi:hypothetical protein